MKTRILLALLLLVGGTANATQFPAEVWQTTCDIIEEQHGLTCEGIEPPIIERGPLPHSYAVYRGGSSIIVASDVNMKSKAINSLLAHEATHYIFSELGVFEFPNHKYIVCPSELVAFRVQRAYAERTGTTYGKSAKGWIEAYPHCEWMQVS